jgi:hypothetical protein
MNSDAPTAFLESFPDTRYFPQWRLVTWHPKGILDDALADRIVEFVEWKERAQKEPFHRFTDFDGLTEVRLKFGHAFELASRRRSAGHGGFVKSAMYSRWIVGIGIAHMFEALMDGGSMTVRAMRTRKAAAEWLEVPVEILRQPPG